MTAAPRTPQPSTRARVPHGQSAAAMTAQLVAMFGDDEGWIEAWHGHADPSTPASIKLDKDRPTRWHWYSREHRPELVRLLVAWSREYGNVYISTTLYSTFERTRAGALPSRVIFIDDAPEHAPIPYSMAVETSAGNRQAYYLLDEPVNAATRHDLQRRIAYALHADKSGHDIEQLGRIAGTWNTKRSAQHPVTLTYADGPRYSVEQLQAQFAQVAHTGPATIGPLATADIELWRGNIGQLLGADGLPRRLSNKAQARRVLAGELTMPSSSDNRACVCRGLVMHRYPDAEIAALLMHFCDYGASDRKGSAWLYEDIARLIAKERARQPHVIPTPSSTPRPHAPAPLPEVPPKSRARQDRPQRVTDDDYLVWCLATMDAGRQVQMTRKEAAAVHGVCPITISRIERRLRERGAIERFENKQTHRSWLAVYAPPMMIIPTPECDAAAAEDAPEVLSGPQRTMDARAHVEGTHPPEQPPAAPSPDPEPQAAAATYPALAEAMREAFAAYHDAGRITRRRIAAYLAANYPGAPWSDQALTYWYGEVLKQRQRERERERLLAGLPSMPHAQLRRLERRCDRLLEEGPDGPHGAQYYFARWLAPHVAQELASDRRRAALERTKVRGGRRPAAPLLALVDAPENVTKSHTFAPMPVQSGDPVSVPQETQENHDDFAGLGAKPCTLDKAMRSPGEVDSETTLWRPNDPMDTPAAAALGAKPCIRDKAVYSPDEADALNTSWMDEHLMDASGERAGIPELHDATPARAPLAAVCSSLPDGLTVPTVEAREPKPATAAAVRLPTVIRPDLYARYAARREQRRCQCEPGGYGKRSAKVR